MKPDDFRLIAESNLLDRDWYLLRNLDVAKTGGDPLLHYLQHGAAEGRDPGPEFCTRAYLERYPDVAEARINPLLHYVRHGRNEGRNTCSLQKEHHQTNCGIKDGNRKQPTALMTIQKKEFERQVKLIRDAEMFDENWYREEYPAVSDDPAVDYLSSGNLHSRNPSSGFDTAFYLQTYPDVANAGQNALVHYILYGKDEGRLPKAGRALTLQRKLWGGFSRYALGELEGLKHSHRESEPEKVSAAWSLMVWYSSRQEYARALDNFAFACKWREKLVDMRRWVLAAAYCQVKLGNSSSAHDLLYSILKRRGFNSDICLAMSNTPPADAVPTGFSDTDSFRLYWINRVFENRGFAPIQKRNLDQGLKLDNLIAPIQSRSAGRGQGKISVLMPAYNSSATIAPAIESILGQTWDDLQLIVVDDCSTDDTFAIAQRYSEHDPRVIAVRQPQNMGAYAARNTAAGLSTGDFITVHDSDDWSHPQKLESQMVPLLDDSGLLGSFSYWVSVDKHMNIVGGWRPWDNLIEFNDSSFLFRRTLLDSLGEWDNVRVAGDTEFRWRAEVRHGNDAFVHVYKDVPLSFSLSSQTSLTKAAHTHVKTVFYGLRRHYREAARWWHSKVDKLENLYLNNTDQSRPFPAPDAIQWSPSLKKVAYVFVVDFSRRALASDSQADALFHAISGIGQAALFHWPNYLLDDDDDVLDDRVFHAAATQGVRLLVPGDQIEAETVVILRPKLLGWLLDSVPTVRCQAVLAINDEVEESEAEKASSITCTDKAVQSNIEYVFGHASVFISFSNFQKRLLEGVSRG